MPRRFLTSSLAAAFLILAYAMPRAQTTALSSTRSRITDKDGNVSFEYDIEKNWELAKNLKGHLMLSTGEIDNNVHPRTPCGWPTP